MGDFTNEIAGTSLGQEFCHLEESLDNRLGVFGGRDSIEVAWECWRCEEVITTLGQRQA
jgi:hypothetical protein